MAYATVPDGVLGDGMIAAWWVPRADITDPTSGLNVYTALNGATAVNVSCLLTQQPTPDVSTETIIIDRICLPVVIEKNGKATWTLEDIVYAYDVQNPASEVNKGYASLTPAAQGWLVLRYLVVSDAAVAAGQIVDVYPIELGAQIKMPLTRNTEATVRQPVKVDGVPKFDLALTAT